MNPHPSTLAANRLVRHNGGDMVCNVVNLERTGITGMGHSLDVGTGSQPVLLPRSGRNPGFAGKHRLESLCPQPKPALSVWLSCAATLVCLAALLAGCGGAGTGWVRVEPDVYLPAVPTQTFEDAEAVSAAPLDKDRVNRPIMLTALSEQEGPRGDVIRAWRLMAIAVPADGTNRLRVFALVGRSTFGRPFHWQFYASKEGDKEGSDQAIANWRYDGWAMVYGSVAAADTREPYSSVRRVFSASLKPRANGDSFRESAQTMIQTLEALRSPPPPTTQRGSESVPPPPASTVEVYDDAIATLRKSLEKPKP